MEIIMANEICKNQYHINTVYGIINNPKYRPHNYTIISLLDLIGVEYDQTYYEANNIIKLLEKKELEN